MIKNKDLLNVYLDEDCWYSVLVMVQGVVGNLGLYSRPQLLQLTMGAPGLNKYLVSDILYFPEK